MTPQRQHRRDDDPSAEVLHGWELWAQLMFLHRGKFIGGAIALAGCMGSAATAVGIRYVGPKQEVARVERKVDTLALRVLRVEQSIGEGASDRAEIKRTLSWLIYMQCKQTRRIDPTDLPPICNEPRQP